MLEAHTVLMCTAFVFVFHSIILMAFNLWSAHAWVICGLRAHMQSRLYVVQIPSETSPFKSLWYVQNRSWKPTAKLIGTIVQQSKEPQQEILQTTTQLCYLQCDTKISLFKRKFLLLESCVVLGFYFLGSDGSGNQMGVVELGICVCHLLRWYLLPYELVSSVTRCRW